MSISQHTQKIASKNKTYNLYFRSFLSAFFYRFAKTLTASKMKTHGRIIAAIYDLGAVIVAWTLANWVLIATIKNLSLSYAITVLNTSSIICTAK